MSLNERVKAFMKAVPLNVSKFCREINLSRAALYDFLNGDLQLSESTRRRISGYLSERGY